MTPEDKVARHLMDYGPALGRRFRALKLWFAIRWYGHEGMAELIESHVELAQEFTGWVKDEPDWEVVAPHVAIWISMHPLDGNVVWTVAGSVKYTTDDGDTWNDAAPFGFSTGGSTKILAHPF